MAPMLFEQRSRAESFGAVAELYHRTRPSYPAALIDALLAGSPSAKPRALDVGCGTGIVAGLLAARGCEVLGVEADERMASVARAHGLEVEVAPFERWRPEGRSFELLACGQAWHWIDPALGARQAAEALVPGGLLGVFWNFGVPSPEVAALFDPIYQRLAPRVEEHSVLLGSSDARTRVAAEGFSVSRAFARVETRTFSWSRPYTREEWVEMLQTHSDHQALEPERRARLLEAIGQAIDSLGGSFELPYEATLLSARRLLKAPGE